MKGTVRILAVLAGANSLYFGWMLAKRLQLPYDAAGRYFDAASGTVLYRQATLAITVLLAAGLLLTAGLIFISRKMR
jgi:hypothetical protein